MNAGQFEAPALESFPGSGGVVVLFPESVGNKQDLRHIPGPEELADDVSSVLQVPGNIVITSSEREREISNQPGGVEGRVGEEQEVSHL